MDKMNKSFLDKVLLFHSIIFYMLSHVFIYTMFGYNINVNPKSLNKGAQMNQIF